MEQSSKVGSIWRIRDVSEGPMTHTLFSTTETRFPPLALRSNRDGRDLESSKKKLIATFFPPHSLPAIDRPKSNVSTPPEENPLLSISRRDKGSNIYPDTITVTARIVIQISRRIERLFVDEREREGGRGNR